MKISTLTPDSCDSNRCPICGKPVHIPPSMDNCEFPCPHCGYLLWIGQPPGHPSIPFGRLWIESANDVTVVRFIDKKILDEQNIQMIGNDLFRLVDELGHRNICLDFANVDGLSSAVLGKLITLNRKIQALRGTLVLRGLSNGMLELFGITKLDKLFTIER